MMKLSGYGTDRGPLCKRCDGTIWTYNSDGDGYVICRCVGCHAVDCVRFEADHETIVGDIRRAHEAFRASMEGR